MPSMPSRWVGQKTVAPTFSAAAFSPVASTSRQQTARPKALDSTASAAACTRPCTCVTASAICTCGSASASASASGEFFDKILSLVAFAKRDVESAKRDAESAKRDAESAKHRLADIEMFLMEFRGNYKITRKEEELVRDAIPVPQGEKREEMALKEFLKQVREAWHSYELDLIKYKNKCQLICGWDDLFNKVKEHINSLASMKRLPYYKRFEEEALTWEEKLNRINALFDVWIDVQCQWVYLEGFFSGADIKALLPEETSRFQSISSEFLNLMEEVSKSPMVMDVLNIPGVECSLKCLADLLKKIQKAPKDDMPIKIIHKKSCLRHAPLEEGEQDIRATGKSGEKLGMFDFTTGDVEEIARNLVYKLEPRVASTLLPGLPAYIIFMCVRHADFTKSVEKIRSLLTAIINAIRRLIKKRYGDLDTSVVWLVNTCRLLDNLKQYSGEKSFQAENTPKQNDQCIRNCDLTEYREALSDMAESIYHQAVINHMKERVEQLIVFDVVLEHEDFSGLSRQKQPVGQGGSARSSSTKDTTSPVDPQEAIARLLHELTMFHQVFQTYGVDPEIIAQVFRQIFYYICACTLNNLLSRKEMCSRFKEKQIEFNFLLSSNLEQWVQDHHVHGQDTNPSITDTIQPIIQAAQLLQVRKSSEDVANICAMCPQLTSAQIIHILLFAPADELEGYTLEIFIRQVQKDLQKRKFTQSQVRLQMDTNFAFAVRFPFSPSSTRLEDIDVPAVLNLPMLKKV